MDSTEIRRRLEHEDGLINQRLSWLVGSQAFLLSAYAIALNAPQQPRDPNYARLSSLIVLLVPWTAVACIAILSMTLAGGIMGMRDLRRFVESDTTAVPIQGRAMTVLLGLCAPSLIPIAFLATWLILVFS